MLRSYVNSLDKQASTTGKDEEYEYSGESEVEMGRKRARTGAATPKATTFASAARKYVSTPILSSKTASMPPALSDAEMSDDDGPDMIPAKGKIPTKEEEVAAAEEEEDDEDDEDDEEGEEYRVEEVLKHRASGREILYQIKWLGYDKKEDLTWEPLENLENAQQALDEYHTKIGGVPEPGKKGKAGKRSVSAAFDSPAVEASGKKRRRNSEVNGTSAKLELPAGSWETEIQRVTSIIEEEEIKGKGGKQLIGLVEWVQGRKTQHKMDVLRRKCPQKLLNYYEQHLVFKNDPAKEDE